MLQREFQLLQDQMRQQLDMIRNRFAQTSDKGTSAESAVREFLRKYLPRRFEVGHGEVVDLSDARSTQTDVVITSDDHPVVFTPDLPGLFFIEGVAAAGEVKSVLGTKELESAITASERFKALKASSRNLLEHSSLGDLHRFSQSRPYFLFAFESQLSMPTILERLQERSAKPEGTRTDLLDAIFVLGESPIVNFGDGEGRFRFRNLETKQLRTGWVWMKSDSTLLGLMTWLSAVMPREIRFEPIILSYLDENLQREHVQHVQQQAQPEPGKLDASK